MENYQLSPDNPMILEIRKLLENARNNIAQQVNTELLTTYWNIGRIIVEYEQQSQLRAEYGKQTLKELSKELTREFGKGFSRSNLQNMRAFYLAYEKCQTPSGKLAWSHYCELLTISDESKRSFYEKEAVNSGWSVRELKRQIESSLYERLLLSSGDANKEKVLSLAQKGIEIGSMSILWTKKVERLCCFFEFLILLLLRCHITNCTMDSFAVIPALYIFKDCPAGFL